MKKYNLAIALCTIMFLANLSAAQFWFQSGAGGDYRSANNNGGSVMIQTIAPQHEVNGSLAYWIGETLSNGAFIQVGYEIPNQTGYLQSNCTLSGCGGTVFVTAGQPAWFWEYFPKGAQSNQFYGSIGLDPSISVNGSFNTYSFNSTGDLWRVYVNGNAVGSVNLGTGSSGQNPIAALAEYANTDSNQNPMPDVAFKNLQFYDGTAYRYVPIAYTIIGYGQGSDQNLPNIYGVQEFDSRTNYFVVGSGLPVQKGAQLWSQGFRLSIRSRYGNMNGTYNYTPFATAQIAMPRYVGINQTTREAFVGWTGTGTGAYTGPANATSVHIYNNITETANWVTQYYVNATSVFAAVSGAGWRNASSRTNVSISTSVVNTAQQTRELFTGWSNGAANTTVSLVVSSPVSISANWGTQYFVNATTDYGTVHGSGWYNANSTADVYLSNTIFNATKNSRIEFESWSNGSQSSIISFKVTQPVQLSAVYSRQYFVGLRGLDAYGNPINVSYFDVNGNVTKNGLFVFADKSYNISHAYYKGVAMRVGTILNGISSPQTFSAKFPVYNISIRTIGVFGIPLSVPVNVTFKNGTTMLASTGASGTLNFTDVPYGYAYGYAEFFGEKQSIAISNGGVATPTFITPIIIAIVFAAIVLIFLIERIYFREKEKPVSIPKRGKNRKRTRSVPEEV